MHLDDVHHDTKCENSDTTNKIDVKSDKGHSRIDAEQITIIKNLQLSSWDGIDSVTDRQICANCGRKRMYFCYDCRAYVLGVDLLTPKIKLSVKVDIIKHWLERNSKSTALHCQLLAPTSTRVFDSFEAVPDYAAIESNVVVVYPSASAISIDEYVKRNGPIQRLVVLDATWFGVKRLCRLPQIRHLPNVALKTYKTNYWRPQKGISDEFLATIEAIYYAVRENSEATRKWLDGEMSVVSEPHENQSERNDVLEDLTSSLHTQAGEDNQFDDLLFWFYFFRGKVKPECRKSNR